MKSGARTYLSLVLVLGIIAIGASCAKAPSDSQVTSELQQKFSADSGLQGKQITVQSANGVITLSGTVDNDAQREAAARYASGITGIRQVVNNLQVAPQAAQAAAPMEEAAKPAATKPKAVAKPKPSTPKEHAKKRTVASHDDMSYNAPPPPTNDSASTSTAVAAPAVNTPPPPPPVKKLTIPTGTTLAIRLVDPIDTETSQPGETFRATLDSPLSVEGEVAIPAGYDVQGHIVDVKSAGKFAGKSELVLQLDRISVGGKSYSVQTDQYKREGSSRGKNTAEKVGAGAAIGAIIGGIAGGGKGAGIGAAAGGGLGGGVQAATKGQQIKLPSETVINFTLQSPVTVTQVEGRNASRPKLDNPQ